MSQTETTAAVCQVELENGHPCGVLAVGRCVFCGHAFCDTHRARFLQHFYTDTCAPCFPKTKEGKQRCEIDNCGNIAVDRCSIVACKRAICDEHRVFRRVPTTGFQPEIIYFPECRPCFDNSPEQVMRVRQAKAEAELRAAQDYFISGGARQDLIAAGVPKVTIYKVELQRKKTFLSSKLVETTVSTEFGWLLGELLWGYYTKNVYGNDVVESGNFLTVMLDRKIDRIYEHLFTRVQPYADGYRDIGEGKRRDDWVLLEKVVKQLCGMPAV